jgi:hypothetical protein
MLERCSFPSTPVPRKPASMGGGCRCTCGSALRFPVAHGPVAARSIWGREHRLATRGISNVGSHRLGHEHHSATATEVD